MHPSCSPLWVTQWLITEYFSVLLADWQPVWQTGSLLRPLNDDDITSQWSDSITVLQSPQKWQPLPAVAVPAGERLAINGPMA